MVNENVPVKSMDGERLIALFKQLTPAIGQTLPSSTEVVLHDLSLSPNSIVAIHGNVTGLNVGDQPTESLRDNVMGMNGDQVVGYYSTLSDGRKICSTTMIIRDVAGTAVAALCINADLSVWDSVQKVLDGMYGSASRSTAQDSSRAFSPNVTPARSASLGNTVATPVEPSALGEKTSDESQSVDALAATLIDNAIAKIELPVEIMHKRHKLEVVRDLKGRGIFQLRDGVDMVASALAVTRFTIYNYLNQLSEGESEGNSEGGQTVAAAAAVEDADANADNGQAPKASPPTKE